MPIQWMLFDNPGRRTATLSGELNGHTVSIEIDNSYQSHFPDWLRAAKLEIERQMLPIRPIGTVEQIHEDGTVQVRMGGEIVRDGDELIGVTYTTPEIRYRDIPTRYGPPVRQVQSIQDYGTWGNWMRDADGRFVRRVQPWECTSHQIKTNEPKFTPEELAEWDEYDQREDG